MDTNTQPAPTTTLTATERAVSLGNRAVELSRLIEGFKAVYEEMEKVTLELVTLQGTGALNTQIVGEQAVTIVDNFEAANTVFRPAAVKRFETKVEDKDKFIKRLKKETSK